MRSHHVVVTCTVFDVHRWLCVQYTRNGISDVVVEEDKSTLIPIALRITRRITGFTLNDDLNGQGTSVSFETIKGNDNDIMEFAKIEAISLDDDGLAAKMVLKTRVANSDSAVAVADFSAEHGVNLFEKLNLLEVAEGNYPLQQTGRCKPTTAGGTGEAYSVAWSTNAEACDDGDGLTVSSQTGKVRVRKLDKRYAAITDVLTLQHAVEDQTGSPDPIAGHGIRLAFEAMNRVKDSVGIGNMQFVFENTTETTESAFVKINAIKEGSPASVATFTHKHVEIPGSIYLLSASKQSIVHEGHPR